MDIQNFIIIVKVEVEYFTNFMFDVPLENEFYLAYN